jgi:tetratricopeptide (TPR) repeat protein
LLTSLTEGRYSPSKALIAGIAKGLTDSPVWTLLDEQRVAFNIVRGLVRRALQSGEKGVVIVRGGPGSGKSVIAAHLLVDLNRSGNARVVHATGSKAFTTNLRAIGPRGSAALFRYFNNFRHLQTEPDSVDVLLCDEAHRIRASSNDRFTRAAIRSTLSQVEELVRAAKVSVFLLDERQNVRVDEVGTVEAIRLAAQAKGIRVEEVDLVGQFRCNGCAGYIEWVDALMSEAPIPVGPWKQAREYEVELFGDPARMEHRIFDRVSQGFTARLVAGFCWPWSDPLPDGTLVSDVEIGSWKRPWNEKAAEQRNPAGAAPAPGRHPYYLWTTQPERVGEIGCIYSAQGFEFDYCGVILGNDLVWRGGIGWVGSRDASHDSSIRNRRLDQAALRQLLHHTYRVLLTRGMKGTYIYSTDPETRIFLAQLLAGAPDAAQQLMNAAPVEHPGDGIVVRAKLGDLLDPLATELSEWKSTHARDPDALNRIVARNYGPLGAYTAARFLESPGAPDVLEVRFTSSPDFDPLRADEHYVRALDHAQKGQLETALDAFTAAIGANPLVAIYYAGAGQAAMELGRLDDAEMLFLRALHLEPTSWESTTMLGNLYYANGKLELARRLHEAAVVLNANEHTLTNFGATLGKLGSYEEARDAFRGALQLNRANLKAQHGLRLCEAALAGPE